MLIETKHFGQVEIDEKEIITFIEGIPGFPDNHQYILLGERDQENPFLWLQAVDSPDPALIVINPQDFYPTYSPRLNKEVIDTLEIKDQEKVLFYSIVVIPEDPTQMRTNLQAPIVINVENNKAKQVILNQPEYKIKHYILQETEGGVEDAGLNQEAK